MRIMAIETSCDETSVSVVENGQLVLANITTSSEELFAFKGGVIPEQAARKQVESILPIVRTALQAASIDIDGVDAIAVTKGPGLLGSLLVGVTTARTLASVWKKPLIGVHHTLGHLCSTWLTEDKESVRTENPFPILSLSASGGHTDLWHRTGHTTGSLIGSTRDDAAGEAFDKGASMLGLPYPGGPSIAKAALEGSRAAYTFPLPLREETGFDFSFSGLKTALKYQIQDIQESGDSIEEYTSDIAASYEHALCMHLLDRIQKAVGEYDVQEIHVVGGVSANLYLRSCIGDAVHIPLRTPEHIRYCTDNAAMIAAAAYYMHAEAGDSAYQDFCTQAAYTFPLPLRENTGFDFSFSGLKTALKYQIQDIQESGDSIEEYTSDIAASYEHALCMHLLDRIQKAVGEYDVQEIHVVGGVSANLYLRSCIGDAVHIPLRTPEHIRYCTDNAAMIAAAAYYMHAEAGDSAYQDFCTQASLPLAEVCS